MRRLPKAEPPLDARWLDALSQNCGELRGGGARFEDLYLEQRLELNAAVAGGEVEIETCRLEGVAARWRSPSRVILHARTGISATAIGELLARHADRVPMPATRLIPSPEMDPPRTWMDWSRNLAQRLAPFAGQVRYIGRRAAVVRAEGWTAISAPALVRVERRGEPSSALLAVWGHPQLASWLEQLLEKPPTKTWMAPAGTRLPVLFASGTAGVFLHEAVGHMAESDLAKTGTSPLAELLGATVSTPGLEVIDDPTRTDLAGAFDFDDEGVRAVPVTLIRNGRFESFLCDREGGRGLRCDAGRGRRAAWSRPPVARLSNLVIGAGTASPEELEGGLEHGLVVTRIGGATVDPVSHRIVLRVERGWEVRHGRRRRALAPCELTGNVLETLANIDPRIGADLTPDWRLGWCVKDGIPLPTGSEAPSLLVGQLEVL
jgi:hypothetical protein